jgi:Ca2+-binding RTX toxin-like protein
MPETTSLVTSATTGQLFGSWMNAAEVVRLRLPLEAPMNKLWAIPAAVLSLVAGGLVAPGVASAVTPSPTVVNFTGDPVGDKADGFSSAAAPQVSFYDTVGANLHLGEFGTKSHGKAIFVGPNDDSALEIRLSAPTNALSLAFGNDDPATVTITDMGRLTLFNGSTQVGQVDVKVNANDVMDQTISSTGEALFNRATFQYVDALGVAKNVAEIVDDITFNPLCTIAGTTGDDNLVGTIGNDVICGDAGDDTISGDTGDDLIYGGAGSDIISGGAGADTIYGGTGDDQVTAGSGNDVVLGDDGDDTLAGGTDVDQINGGTGNDDISGNTGGDQLVGGTGDDHLSGGGGRDQVSGGSGRDVLSGGRGRDQLSGGHGRDVLSGGRARDHLAGGTARDQCDGGKAHDIATSCEVRTDIP